jgi:hypothetical protein
MSDEALTEVASPLAPLATRHPEKTLHLGQVFNDTTNSHKLLWFLAILHLTLSTRTRAWSRLPGDADPRRGATYTIQSIEYGLCFASEGASV